MKKIAALLLICLLMPWPAGAAESEGRQPVELPVLMYHRILKNNPSGDIYTITPAALEEDLRYLRDAGYTAVSVRELIDYVKNCAPLPAKPIVLTFDDGYYNNIYYGAPLLEKYGMKAAVFIVGKFSEKSTLENAVNPVYSYILWEQMESLPSCLELQNHTWDMHNLRPRKGIGRKQREGRAEYELELSADLLKLQAKIKQHTGTAPAAFAYPFGVDCSEARDVFRAVGIEASFCSRHGINTLTPGDADSLYGLKRLLRTPKKSAERLIAEYSRVKH